MWQGFFEHLRECGRNGAPFYLALLAVLASGALGAWGLAVMAVALALGVVWVGVTIARQRPRFGKLGKMPPLSETDLHRARSRLTGHRVRNGGNSSPSRQAR